MTVPPSRSVRRAGTNSLALPVASLRSPHPVERLHRRRRHGRPRHRARAGPRDSSPSRACWGGRPRRRPPPAPAASSRRQHRRRASPPRRHAHPSSSRDLPRDTPCETKTAPVVRSRPARASTRGPTPSSPRDQGGNMDIVKLVCQLATPAVLGADRQPARRVRRARLQKGLGAAIPGVLAGLLGASKRPGIADALGSALSDAGGLGDLLGSNPAAAATKGSDLLSSLLGGDAAGALTERARLLCRRAQGRRRLAPRPRRLHGARRARQGGGGQGPRRRRRPRPPRREQGRDHRRAPGRLRQGARRQRALRRPAAQGGRRRAAARRAPPPPPRPSRSAPRRPRPRRRRSAAGRGGSSGWSPGALPPGSSRGSSRRRPSRWSRPRRPPPRRPRRARGAPSPRQRLPRRPNPPRHRRTEPAAAPAPAARRAAPSDTAAAPANPLVVGGVDIGASVSARAREHHLDLRRHHRRRLRPGRAARS